MAKPTKRELWKQFKHELPSMVRDVLPTLGRWIFHPPSGKSIGYWARDRYGRWELRVPAFRVDERHPA
jgi:hypothetical protein